jgi:hypothetical protein
MQALRRSLGLAIVCALGLAVAGGAHAAGPSFTPAPGSPFGVGDEPHSIASGDFNRDGKLDLATANISSDSVSLLFGNGAGTFAPAPSFAVGDQPHSLVAGDFNRDLKLDLAVANSKDDTISVLLGNGAGGFREAAGSPLAAGGGRRVSRHRGLERRPQARSRRLERERRRPVRARHERLDLPRRRQRRFRRGAGISAQRRARALRDRGRHLNRDGKLDLAVAGQFGGTVSIRPAGGSGPCCGHPS